MATVYLDEGAVVQELLQSLSAGAPLPFPGLKCVTGGVELKYQRVIRFRGVAVALRLVIEAEIDGVGGGQGFRRGAEH